MYNKVYCFNVFESENVQVWSSGSFDTYTKPSLGKLSNSGYYTNILVYLAKVVKMQNLMGTLRLNLCRHFSGKDAEQACQLVSQLTQKGGEVDLQMVLYCTYKLLPPCRL